MNIALFTFLAGKSHGETKYLYHRKYYSKLCIASYHYAGTYHLKFILWENSDCHFLETDWKI